MAEKLDPLDPTPHLYNAIRMQTANRPVDALQEVGQSVVLNDNRAVYRSEFKLDEDLAVRSSSQGRIYRDLGFESLANLAGWKSVTSDPGDFSGHRLLADTYSGVPRHEVARVNELYTSQLLQPRNLTPVPPQLGEANLFILDTAGPSDIAFNEFNPLFNSDGQAFHASATVGGNDTWGEDVAFALLQGRWSLSLGQFHFETDGFHVNNDLEQDVYNAFVQYRQSEDTNVVAEVRVARREQGDLQLLFDPSAFDPDLRVNEESDSARLGVHHQFSTRSEILASLVYQDASSDNSTQITSIPAFFGLTVDTESLKAEIQHILHRGRWRLVSGLRQSWRDQFDTRVVDIAGDEDISREDYKFESTSAYAYAYINPVNTLSVLVGVAGDLIDGRAGEVDQVSPKLGLTWDLSSGTTLRLAAFRTSQPFTFSRQDIPPRLEPTQVSGFNQFYSGAEGQDEWRYGLGLDHRVSEKLYLGAEVTKRDIEYPVIFAGPPDSVFNVHAEEVAGQVYTFWMPMNRWALSARYQYDEETNDEIGASVEGNTLSLNTHRVLLGTRYFHPAGLSAEAEATYVDQSGEFQVFILDPPFVLPVRDGDRFWVLDAAIRYRLPRRMGIVSVEAQNLLDEDINFQDVDPANPEIVPERFVSVQFTIEF